MGSIRISGEMGLPKGQYFLPPEVWHMIGEKIESRKQLRNLVLTCRAFRDIFSPMAYASRTVQLHSASPWEWKYNLIPSNVVFTQDLKIDLKEFRRRLPNRWDSGDGVYERGWPAQYALFLTKVLQNITNLRNFQWKDSSTEPDFSPALMLKDSKLLNRLKKCQSLEGLTVEFSPIILEGGSSAMHCWMPLNGFANLTNLELYNFRGNNAKIVKEIAGVLSRSPTLKVLGLAMNCDFLRQDGLCDAEVIIIDEDLNFMHTLCVEYELRSSSPLNLHTLRLGNGIYLETFIDYDKPLPKNCELNNYLVKLIDVTKLKKIHMFNGLVISDFELRVLEPKIEWRLLEQCTSLRQLSVSRLGLDLTDWLIEGIHSFDEFLIWHHFDIEEGPFQLAEYPLDLSMLVLWEATSCPEVDDDLWNLNTSNSDVPLETISMFDRRLVTHTFLERLSICIEFEDQWERFETHLMSFTRLTELRLNCKSLRTGPYPAKVSSLWPGVTKAKDIARHYAELAKSKCDTLQLIRIGRWAWQFLSSIETDALGPPPMRELDWDEMMSIELFALSKFTSGAGLPEKDRWTAERSDEELNRLEEFYFELAWAEQHLPEEKVIALRDAFFQEICAPASDATSETRGLTRPQMIASFELGYALFKMRSI